MSLIKKRDVKMYFSERRRKGLHLVPTVIESPATELPVSELPIEANAPVFVDDFSLEHSSSGGTVSAVVMVTACDDTETPTS